MPIIDSIIAGTNEDSTFFDTAFVPRTAVPLIPEDSSYYDEGETADSDTALIPVSADSAGAVPAPGDSAQIRPAPELYPGISAEQHLLVVRMLDFFYAFDWDNAEKTAKKLQRLEKKQHLPPFSYLYMVGMRVFRIIHGEYENDNVRKGLLRDIEKLSARGLELADPQKTLQDSCLATNLLITGGIKGFNASLEIDRNPVNAALNALSSFKFLKKAAERDTMMSDAFLGLGLFNCVMAKSSIIVRGALAIIGKEVSFSRGIAYLRICAYHGRYTNTLAKLYLIDFLSPYMDDEAKEKRMLLRSLQRRYPQNPYFTFLELEENLCFHRASLFDFPFKGHIKRQIGRFTLSNYSARRFAALVQWQYLFIDPFSSESMPGGMLPDKKFDLRAFAYYPVFLQALREKNIYDEIGTAGNAEDREKRQRFIRAMGARAIRMLDASEYMSSARKGVYLWHIRDALRTERESDK